MKRNLFLTAIILLLFGFVATAQVEKSNWLITGSSGLGISSGKSKVTMGSTTNESGKDFGFFFQPQVGYFVINKLAAGLMVNFSYDKSKNPEGDDYSSWTTIMAGPFVRYYIVDLKGLMPYGEVSAAIGSQKYKSKFGSIESEDKSSLTSLNLGIGGTYFVTDNVGLDLSLGYGFSSDKQEAGSENGDRSASSEDDITYKYSGINMNIGVVVTLGNK